MTTNLLSINGNTSSKTSAQIDQLLFICSHSMRILAFRITRILPCLDTTVVKEYRLVFNNTFSWTWNSNCAALREMTYGDLNFNKNGWGEDAHGNGTMHTFVHKGNV